MATYILPALSIVDKEKQFDLDKRLVAEMVKFPDEVLQYGPNYSRQARELFYSICNNPAWVNDVDYLVEKLRRRFVWDVTDKGIDPLKELDDLSESVQTEKTGV